jgi:flagellar hook protein FlgE
MNSSFYNGVSGVKTHQFGMDVWANNITNINTAGFKYATPEFSTVFSQSFNEQYGAASTNDNGLGSTKVASAAHMTMGSLVQTDSQFDMAIQGKGFFGIQDNGGSVYYTRNGSFSRDGSGNLVDTFGNYVLGQSANNISDGIITNEKVGDIKLTTVDSRGVINLPDKLTLPAEQTTYVKMKGNLNSTPKYTLDENGQKVEEANVEVYRSVLYKKDGDKNFLEVVFKKQVPQGAVNVLWDATATVKDSDDNVLSTESGVLTFDGTGAFLSSTLKSIKSDGIDVKLDFGSPLGSSLTFAGRDGLVSYNSDAEGKSITTDGHTAGNLTDYGVDNLGNIEAIFDNGKSVPIYKVMVFNFQNEQGLNQTSPIYYQESPNSGEASLFRDKDGNALNQSIINRHLEMSNVNMSTAMTELIVMQKAYEASAKSITTSDQMIQNAINMKK